MNENFYNFKLLQMVDEKENILWQSKPNKTCFILESIFNPFAAFALVWFLFDAFLFLGFSTSSTIDVNGVPTPTNEAMKTIIPFFALHLMPVWIYLGGVLLSFNKYKNTEYIITDKSVYISSGIFEVKCERKKIKNLSDINIRQGFFDRFIGVGDVIIEKYMKGYGKNRREVEVAIHDIPDFQNVYSMITDLHSDINKLQEN